MQSSTSNLGYAENNALNAMQLNYNNKKFKSISNSEHGEVTPDLIFHYKQRENILTCLYQGANIVEGQLIGLVDAQGCIEMKYQQINKNGVLMTGTCRSTPEKMDNGKIRLYENWQWTSGDQQVGSSILEEI